MADSFDHARFPWIASLTQDVGRTVSAALSKMPAAPQMQVTIWRYLAQLLAGHGMIEAECECLAEMLKLEPDETHHRALIEKLASVVPARSDRLLAQIADYTDQYGDNGAVLFILALQLFAKGQTSASKAALARALLADPAQMAAIQAHPDPGFCLATFPALVGTDLALWRIGRKSPWLGTAATTLSPVSERLIATQLDLHNAMWRDGQTPRPDGFQREKAPSGYEISKDRRILMLLTRHVNCHPDFIETDLTQQLTGGSRGMGLNFRVFDADEILYGTSPNYSPDNLRHQLNLLSALINDFDPEIILFDG